MAAVHDGDGLTGASTAAAETLHLSHDVHAGGDRAEDDVLAIEPWGFHGGEEKLHRNTRVDTVIRMVVTIMDGGDVDLLGSRWCLGRS